MWGNANRVYSGRIMPKTIRRALYRKILELPELAEFQRDFALVSGMKLAFVDELGLGEELDTASSPMCQAMFSCGLGRAMCARARHGLLAGGGEIQAGEPSGRITCDAGLSEAAVSLKIGGIHAGYFVFGGVRIGGVDPHGIRRTAHLLHTHGIDLEEGSVREYLEASPEVALATFEACQRMVRMFSRQLALKLTDQLAEPDVSMPPLVVRACRFIRQRALLGDLDLAGVAAHCGVSTGHLSRKFHQATGLTFREYMARFRVDYARDLLMRGRKSVSEAAYDAGFQSLSQFHRVFQKAFGVSPGKMRRDAGFKMETGPRLR